LNVYDTENGNDRVQKFDSTGAYVSILGGLSSGTGNGQFDAPYGVAVDSSGNVYVADTNNNRVQVLNSSLVYQSQWGAYGTTNGTLDAPTGIAADPDGNLIITNDGASATEPAVQKFSAGGTLMKVIAVEGPSTGQIKGDAFYIAVDSNKNVYVADYGGARVDKFAPY
jgi:DNA-binding beta-propeller fold protein YncE